MTYEEIEANYPEEFALRRENKLGYRYPRGESYLGVIPRLDPLIQELESYQEPVLIVGHQGVLRLIYAYFMGMDRADACTASIPLEHRHQAHAPDAHVRGGKRRALRAKQGRSRGGDRGGRRRGRRGCPPPRWLTWRTRRGTPSP